MKMFSSTSTVKMKSVSFSETLVITYQITRFHNPEYHRINLHRHTNLRSHEVTVEISTVFIVILIYLHKLLRIYIYKLLLENQINFNVILSKGSGGIL